MITQPNVQQGRREIVAIVVAGVMIQALVGTVASLRGDSVAWGSLVHRPLLLIALGIAALTVRRLGYLLLLAWCCFLAVVYVYGGFAASYVLLMILRWLAAVVFGWSAVRLTTSVHVRAYRSR